MAGAHACTYVDFIAHVHTHVHVCAIIQLQSSDAHQASVFIIVNDNVSIMTVFSSLRRSLEASGEDPRVLKLKMTQPDAAGQTQSLPS